MSHCDFETCEGLDGWNPQKGLKLFFYGMFKTTEEKEISGTIENPETFRDSPQSPQGLGIRPNHSSMTDSLAGKTKFPRNLTWVVGS